MLKNWDIERFNLIINKLIQDGYRYQELQFDYNKVSRKGDKSTTEVIITNY